MRTSWPRRAIAVLVGATGLGLIASSVHAQGCEPIRFTTPIDLGGEGQAYQPSHQWRVTLGYRRLHSSQFFVGTSQNPALAPGGESPVFDIHSFVANVGYSLSDRLQVSASLPFSTASISRKWADSAHHEQRATGLGDLSALGELWLLNPRSHQGGNVAVALGVKAPTGSHTKGSTFYTATGSVAFPADQTVQPGDGGWAVIFQAQAFQRVREGLYVYGFGSYVASPRGQSDALLAPTGPASLVHWSVPDVYQARLGAALSVWPSQGLTLSLGARMDGIPRRDLLGGGDSTTVKRTSQIIFADPGVSLNRGKSSFTLGIPVRVHVNRMKSLLEERTPSGQLSVNGGGFAKYVVFASYSYRF
jgi:hypothetical protein